jgi:uncharacterized repeat protein (TIGR01451 family)
MNKLLKRVPKKSIGFALALAVIGASAASAYAWYPNRQTFTVQNPAPYPTFDSITNNPNYGDERTFFDAKNATNTNSGGYADDNTVTDGETVLMRMYVHNNAASNLNASGQGIAHNTRVRVYVPTATAKNLRSNAYISSSNATPQQVSDSTDLHASQPFSLSYVPGSAVTYNNAHPKGMALSDSIVSSNGAPIGYQQTDGNVPGCFQYVNIVTIKVKVHMNVPEYKVNKEVRFKGQGPSDWTKSLVAKNGKTVQWSLEFTDNGNTELKQVNLVDNVPKGLNVVPGSVVLYNGNYPNGYTFPASAVQNNGRQINLNIGDYLPLSNADQAKGQVSAQVIFATKIDEPECGSHTLTNKVYATPQGYGAIWSTAKVKVNNAKCQTPTTPTTPSKPNKPNKPTQLPNTGPGAVAGLFAGVSGLGTAGSYIYRRRRYGRQ